QPGAAVRMRVVPVQASAIADLEAIAGLRARGNRMQTTAVVALVDTEAMPVDRARLVKLVVEINCQLVALAQAQQRVARIVPVYRASVARDARGPSGKDRRIGMLGAQREGRPWRNLRAQTLMARHAQRLFEPPDLRRRRGCRTRSGHTRRARRLAPCAPCER